MVRDPVPFFVFKFKNLFLLILKYVHKMTLVFSHLLMICACTFSVDQTLNILTIFSHLIMILLSLIS